MKNSSLFLLCIILSYNGPLFGSEDGSGGEDEYSAFQEVQVPSEESEYTLQVNFDALSHYNFRSRTVAISISGSQPTRIMKQEDLEKVLRSSINFNSSVAPTLLLHIYKEMFPSWKLLEKFNMAVQSIDTGEKSDPNARMVKLTITDDVTSLQEISIAAYSVTQSAKGLVKKIFADE